MPTLCHYEVLQVSRSADVKVITAAYRALAKLHHPDSHGGDSDAAERMKRINEAYETLSDEARRAAYDRELDSDAGRPEGPDAAPQPPDELTVGDGGDYRTVGEAAAAAAPGSTLRLRPGRYSESLVLRSDLTIRGEEPGAVTWIAAESFCLGVDGANVEVADVAFESEVTDSEPDVSPLPTALEILRGSLTLRRCTITADRGACLAETDDDQMARVALHECTFASCRWGVAVQSGNAVELIDTTLDGCVGGGAIVMRGATASLTNCRCDNNEFGCAAIGGAVTISKSTFDRNKHAVFQSKGGTVSVSGCAIINSLGDAVTRTADGGETRLEVTSVSDGAEHGVHLKGPAATVLKQVRLERNQKDGLRSIGCGDLRVEACIAEDNGGDALDVRKAKSVSVAGSMFRTEENEGKGIYLKASDKVAIRDCGFGPIQGTAVEARRSTLTLHGSSFARCLYGVVLWKQSTARLDAVRIEMERGSGYGVYLDEESTVALEACEVTGGYRGVDVQGGSRAEVSDCVVGEASNNALFAGGQSRLHAHGCRLFASDCCGAYFNESSGSLEHCSVYRNRRFGVAIIDGSEAAIRACRITQNAGLGVGIAAAHACRLEGCDLAGNAEGPWASDEPRKVDAEGNRTEEGFHPHDHDPYVPGSHHTRQHDETYFAPLAETLDAVQAFVRTHMHDWRHEDSRHGPDGRSLLLCYARRFSQHHRVKESGLGARIAAGLRAGSGGSIAASGAIDYDLRCEIAVEQVEDWMTRVAMTIEEQIDRDGQAGRQFGGWTRPFEQGLVAPSQLHADGYFGLQLMPFVCAQLTPTKS